MKNIEQLLNKENWIEYIRIAHEGGLTDNAIANDIVAEIQEVVTKLKNNGDLGDVSGSFDSESVIDEIDEEIKRVNECLDVSWKHLQGEVKYKKIGGLKPFLLQIETYNNVINGLNVMRERALANER